MGAPRTKCTACGRETLQSTADRKGGLFAPCEMKGKHADRRSQRELLAALSRPVSRALLDELILREPRDVVIGALFYPACESATFRPNAMTEGEIIVYSVWTVLGQTCGDGIYSYFIEISGGCAHHCAPSLRTIGADDYAEVIE